MDCNGLVSVIIPVYNVRPYLEEALDSVLAQTYTNLEIIVIDDGSTDGSGQVCDAYAQRDARVQVVHQQNRGLSAARNAGLDRMTGEMVAFLDPDDAFHERFIELTASAMAQEDADMVLCRYSSHAAAGRLAGRRSRMVSPSIAPGRYDRVEALRALADGAVNVAVWNKLYRRSVWRDLRFPVGHVYEDISTSMGVVDRCKRVCALEQILCFHRRRRGSITLDVSPEKIGDLMLAFSVFSSFIEEHIPGVFSQEQLMRVRRKQLNSLLACYARLIGRTDARSDRYAVDLKRQILEKGQALGMKNLDFKTRIGCRMLRDCPWLLRLLYPVYHAVRMGIWRVAGK